MKDIDIESQSEDITTFGPLYVQYLTKNEILISQNREINIYKINKKFNCTKLDVIKTEYTLRNIITKEDNIIALLNNGDIIIFKKNPRNKYIKFKTIKFYKIKYLLLLNLKEQNLICGFTSDTLYIIDIYKSTNNSKFIFLKKEIKDKKDVDKENDEIENNEDALNVESQPFLIKVPQKNNFFICFKQVANFCIFDYNKMKIIKKIKVEKNLSFQIYKPEDTYNYFFLILINEEGFIKVQKINNNLKIVESSKISFKFPYFTSDSSEESEYDELPNESITLHKCSIKDINNFYFIYYAYRGAPFESDSYFFLVYKNGKQIKKQKLGKSETDQYDSEISFQFIDINKKNILMVKSTKMDDIYEVKFTKNIMKI